MGRLGGEPHWRGLERRSADALRGYDSPRPTRRRFGVHARGKAGDGTAFGTLFRRECKATSRGQMTVKWSWLKDLREGAAARNALPVLVLGFADANDVANGVSDDWACVPMRLFTEMVEAWIDTKRRGSRG